VDLGVAGSSPVGRPILLGRSRGGFRKRLPRDAHGEGAAAPYCAPDFDLGMMSVGDGLAYREAESGTARVPAARAVGTIETVENPR